MARHDVSPFKVLPRHFEDVVFYGAGASCGSGLPLTRDLTALALRALFAADTTSRTRGSVSELRGILSPLLPGLVPVMDRLLAGGSMTRSEERTWDIGAVLSLIDERLQQESWLGGQVSNEALRRARRLIQLGVVHAIGDGIHRVLSAEDAVPRLPLPVTTPRAMVTTNWDTLIEAACGARFATEEERKDRDGYEGRLPDDIYLGGIKSQQTMWGAGWCDPAHPSWVLHLNGAVNWAVCDACGGSTYLRTEVTGKRWLDDSHAVDSEGVCSCIAWWGRPFIVTPSLRETQSSTLLRAIWRAALRALSTGRRWTFIGYSLPSQDVAVRALLTEAQQQRRRNFGDEYGPDWLVLKSDAGPSGEPVEEIADRYRAILPAIGLLDCGVERITFGPDGLVPPSTS